MILGFRNMQESIPTRKRKTIKLEFVNWEMAEEEQQYEHKKKCIRLWEQAYGQKFIYLLTFDSRLRKPVYNSHTLLYISSNSNQTSGHASFMFVFFLLEKEFWKQLQMTMVISDIPH